MVHVYLFKIASLSRLFQTLLSSLKPFIQSKLFFPFPGALTPPLLSSFISSFDVSFNRFATETKRKMYTKRKKKGGRGEGKKKEGKKYLKILSIFASLQDSCPITTQNDFLSSESNLSFPSLCIISLSSSLFLLSLTFHFLHLQNKKQDKGHLNRSSEKEMQKKGRFVFE